MATPPVPVQVIVSVAGPSMPTYVTWVDGIGYVPPSTVQPDPHSMTSVTPSVTSVTSSVTSVPSVMSMQSNPSFPSMPSGMSQILQGPSGPSAIGTMPPGVGSADQAAVGAFVPASVGYMGPLGWAQAFQCP